jgi:hypothetical protein
VLANALEEIHELFSVLQVQLRSLKFEGNFPDNLSHPIYDFVVVVFENQHF